MRVSNYNDRTCFDYYGKNGKVEHFQLLIVAETGHGKGLTSEALAERWKQITGGVVIFLNDPKQEAEQSFVNYYPEEKYHLDELKKDRIKKNKYKAKLYHPFTFNLSKKGFLPPMNIYTLSIKDMTREDWSILAETDAETETIKLLERVSEDLHRKDSLFDFLHQIRKLTLGNKKNKKPVPNPNNWNLPEGGGTSKSIKHIGNMLSSFRKNYFLRKDNCDLKLDWEKILSDSESYHVFLTNWIDNPKLRNFLVEALMGRCISEAQRLNGLGKFKKPILFMIPELKKVCPADVSSKSSSYFLAKALGNHIVTMRSKASGMYCIGDTQNWSLTHPEVRGSFSETLFGKLNVDDARIIFKAKQYNSAKRKYFEEIQETSEKCSFILEGKEDIGIFKFFLPGHMHKEREYNWIQMYKKHFRDDMVRYDDLVNQMKKEFNEEDLKSAQDIQKLLEDESEDKKEKKGERVEKTKVDTSKEYLYKRAWELRQEGLSYQKIANEIGIKSHKTAQKYIKKYEEEQKQEKQEKKPEEVKKYIGDGVLPEEISSNFDFGSVD